jgi:hypothetical protein
MYTLTGLDLTAHSSNRLGGRRRRYHYLDHAASYGMNVESHVYTKHHFSAVVRLFVQRT